MNDLIELAYKREGYIVLPARGLPATRNNAPLPTDLAKFYTLCGGIDIDTSTALPLSIVEPNKFTPANQEILIGLSPEQLAIYDNHPSSFWYILAKGENSQYVSMSLGADDYGKCFNSFWDIHPDNSSVIANSFTDFLKRVLSYEGSFYYWEEPEFLL